MTEPETSAQTKADRAYALFITHLADCETCHTASSNVYAAESEGLPQDYCDTGQALHSAYNSAEAETTPPSAPSDGTPF